MADIVLTGKDYINFDTTYSDLNIIRNVKGEEYSINEATVSNFTILNGNLDFSNVEDFSTIPNIIGNYLSYKKDWLWLDLFTRGESVYKIGKCVARTETAIYNSNNISIIPKIKYRKYYVESDKFSILNGENYKSSSLIYEQIRQEKYAVKNTEDNYIFETEKTLPFNLCSANMTYALGIKVSESYPETSKQEYPISDIRIVSVDESGTTIEFDYRMLIWRGYNSIWHGFLGSYSNSDLHLYVVDSIEFQIQANGVDVSVNDFSYVTENSQSFATDDPYELESNELMQYTVGQPQDEKISKITADKIFDGTNINRQIVSFDLLNVQKYDFDNGDGTKTRRYLTSRDKIKIKDENDNWVGEYNDDNGNVVVPYFEIIQIENVWDGSFYKRVTAKQVL